MLCCLSKVVVVAVIAAFQRIYRWLGTWVWIAANRQTVFSDMPVPSLLVQVFGRGVWLKLEARYKAVCLVANFISIVENRSSKSSSILSPAKTCLLSQSILYAAGIVWKALHSDCNMYQRHRALKWTWPTNQYNKGGQEEGYISEEGRKGGREF